MSRSASHAASRSRLHTKAETMSTATKEFVSEPWQWMMGALCRMGPCATKREAAAAARVTRPSAMPSWARSIPGSPMPTTSGAKTAKLVAAPNGSRRPCRKNPRSYTLCAAHVRLPQQMQSLLLRRRARRIHQCGRGRHSAGTPSMARRGEGEQLHDLERRSVRVRGQRLVPAPLGMSSR